MSEQLNLKLGTEKVCVVGAATRAELVADTVGDKVGAGGRGRMRFADVVGVLATFTRSV